MTYQSPSRPRSPEWTAAMAWWRDQPDRLSLRRRHRLVSCVRIVGYWVRLTKGKP
jgi:hypothetical protein